MVLVYYVHVLVFFTDVINIRDTDSDGFYGDNEYDKGRSQLGMKFNSITRISFKQGKYSILMSPLFPIRHKITLKQHFFVCICTEVQEQSNISQEMP